MIAKRWYLLIAAVLGLFNAQCNKVDTGPLIVSTQGLGSGQSYVIKLYNVGDQELESMTIDSNDYKQFSNKYAENLRGYYRVSEVSEGITCSTSDGIFSGDDSGSYVYVKCAATAYTVSFSVSGLADGESITARFSGEEKITFSENGTSAQTYSIADQSSYRFFITQMPTSQQCSTSYNFSNGRIDGANVTISITCFNAHRLLRYPDTKRGDFGGETQANTFCSELVGAHETLLSCPAGVVGFMSFSDTKEIRDIPTNNSDMSTALPVYIFDQELPYDAYFGLQNNSKIADDWTDLLDGSIDSGLPYISYWTGSNASGVYQSSESCSGWTSTNGTTYVGENNSPTDSKWLRGYEKSCSEFSYILCLCMQEEESTEAETDTDTGTSSDTATTYSVSGSLSGFSVVDGELELTLTVDEEEAETLTFDTDGIFTFTEEVAADSEYEVTVTSTPDHMECEVTNGTGTASADVDNISIACWGDAHFLYLSSSNSVAGSIGTRSQADALCESLKDGTYPTLPCSGTAAFLSYSTTDEIRDFPTMYSLLTDIEIQNANNSFAKVADDWADLLDGSIDSAITQSWWSGSMSDGSVFDGFNCTGWTASGGDAVVVGSSASTDNFWTGMSDGLCSTPARLLCLCYQEAP